MTQDESIRMAREAGFTDIEATALEYFYQAAFAAGAAHEKKFWMEQIEVECNEAVLAEREACAKVCLETGIKHPQQSWQEACAAAIRAMGDNG